MNSNKGSSEALVLNIQKVPVPKKVTFDTVPVPDLYIF